MNIKPVIWKNVKINGGLLKERQKTIATNTLKHIFNQYEKKGRLDIFNWRKGKPDMLLCYQDSDVAKLIEAIAYSIIQFPDIELKNKMEEVIDDLLSIQESDGYLNSYFHKVAPDKKWTDLRTNHEMYSAGHLIEAGIAWKLATGDDKLFNGMCKYADLICNKFGTKEGQIRSWPGHPEIELALIKLYHITGNKKYFDTAKFFVEDRGNNTEPWFEEAKKLGNDICSVKQSLKHFLADIPVKQQKTAEGHAVRVGYFFSAMADVVLENNDTELWNICEKIWHNIVDRRINIAGGIGSEYIGESFSSDYCLNEEYYYESCAQISMFFFAWRMFLNKQKAEYVDIMELTLYNSILSGIDVPGKAFFYSNPLVNYTSNYKSGDYWGSSIRQKDFGCSCCPPNISRFIASVGQYIYASSVDSIWVNLFIDSEVEFDFNEGHLILKMQTNYPWDENISIKISVKKTLSCKLNIRIPAWVHKFDFSVNGNSVDYVLKNGYAFIERNWNDGDQINLVLPLKAEVIEAHPAVRQAAGKVALKRGPIVYCIEEVDNDNGIFNVMIPVDSKILVEKQNVAGFELPVLKLQAKKRIAQPNEPLYHPVNTKFENFEAIAIPYFMWANRGENEMTTWIKRCSVS